MRSRPLIQYCPRLLRAFPSVGQFVDPEGDSQRMDKRVTSAEAAVARIHDGATILMGGFGASGVAENLVRALCRQGTRDLTIVSNNAGINGYGIDLLLK